MLSKYPLDLPEIVGVIASHVPWSSLPACARVSKTWHQVFTPFLWRAISLHKHSETAIYTHRHHVRTLHTSFLPQELKACRFPNLKSLTATVGIRSGSKQEAEEDKELAEFILGHPSVKHLCIHWLNLESTFWDGLLDFRNLREFSVSDIDIEQEDMDKFWKLCTQLEKLTISQDGRITRGNLTSMEFTHIRELRLREIYNQDDSLQLEIAKRCPGLTSISWDSYEYSPFNEFSWLVSEKLWPNLESVSVKSEQGYGQDGGYVLDDGDLSRIIGGMKQISSLCVVDTVGSFEPEWFQSLQRHFSGLKTLEIDNTTQVTSSMVQEIMSSCPLLEELKVPRIEASDIVSGKPWICVRLRVLKTNLRFTSCILADAQPLVFDQLSKLTQVEVLHFDSFEGYSRTKSSATALRLKLDLRLEMGLGKLSTLQVLRDIHFQGIEQMMGEKDIEWMLEHWKCLSRVYGVLNNESREANEALGEMFRSHNIVVRG
ncbi:hypothetical protein B0O80DRAFT_429803 [Mortierella sp. GBAus27b]|nr:hypothetical protein B0O80DRAFT_429803 [Mortierella sp. GBAus27b]